MWRICESIPFDESAEEDGNMERFAKGEFEYLDPLRIGLFLSNRSSFPLFPILDVANARTKEDMLFLLAQVARQFEQQDSVTMDYNALTDDAAQSLVSSLQNAVLLRDGSLRKYYRTSLTYNRALQCTVLITAIEMLLRCSPETVADKVDLLRGDLVPSILKLLRLYIAWDGGDTIRLLAISNVIKIIRRVGPLCKEGIGDFVDALLSVLRTHMGATPTAENDIHVDAAQAIAHLFDQQDRPASRKRFIEKIQDDSSLIISTLSTAALATANYKHDVEILTGLFNFACNSHIFRTKMARRRCSILAIGRHMKSPNVETRKLSLNIFKCLLNGQKSAVDPARMDINSELLVSQVLDSAINEKEPMLQIFAISLLSDAIQNANLSATISDNIFGTLKMLANDIDGQDEIVMEASAAYCKAASSLHPKEIQNNVLFAVAEFTTLPFARSRSQAIKCIDYFATNDTITANLLTTTEIMENFSLIITYGSDDDCTASMNVLRLLARNPAHRRSLCQSSTFLNALVRFVTKEEVTNRDAYVGGIETCLALLEDNDNVRSFLPYPDLLPFFVALANTTAPDDEAKPRLVSAIIRLSSALLG
jgi:hypothetical protein